MSQGPGVVFMNNGVLLAIVFAGDHDAEFVINLKEDDRHHQRAGQIEGVVLSEGEIVRHREAPVLWRGTPPPPTPPPAPGGPRAPPPGSPRATPPPHTHPRTVIALSPAPAQRNPTSKR